ncbi:CatA-like O-acetyltransferase [Enterococcus sp. 5H]|uniref:CatA-like O-acetyltransferase n=1 Tax=Enterococcus sp. 5H TaxID=1229490 RepID=UPI002303A922|nr:CatA-like O-acetyltransferase [Enterococcus sp. 5H]MDA9472008.1 chloramphenicol acetyltransferase [Enterococcus sp. 5H]
MTISANVIDQSTWKRKEHFDFFSGEGVSPLYDVTTQLDVTHFYRYVKHNRLSFYYGLIAATTEVMNQIENFRYKVRGDEVVLVERLIPSFTDLKAGSELFHIVTLDFQGSLKEFSDEAKRVSDEQQDYFPPSEYQQDTMIQFSCLPWFSFTNLGNELSLNRDDSIPKVTWGKFEQIGERLLLPYSVQVNHRLVDGIHLGKLINQLQNYLDNLVIEHSI